MVKFVIIFGLFRMFLFSSLYFILFYCYFVSLFCLFFCVFLSIYGFGLCETYCQFTVDVLLFGCVIGFEGLEVSGETN